MLNRTTDFSFIGMREIPRLQIGPRGKMKSSVVAVEGSVNTALFCVRIFFLCVCLQVALYNPEAEGSESPGSLGGSLSNSLSEQNLASVNLNSLNNAVGSGSNVQSYPPVRPHVVVVLMIVCRSVHRKDSWHAALPLTVRRQLDQRFYSLFICSPAGLFCKPSFFVCVFYIQHHLMTHFGSGA